MLGPVIATTRGRGQLSPMAEGRAAGDDWSQWFDHFWQAKGAASYAASLLDLVGVQNLVEGNGAVPWAAGTGWGFVAAFAQWLDMGLIPANDQSWSCLAQFNNSGANFLVGATSGGGPRQFYLRPNVGAVTQYNNGGQIQIAPANLAGSAGVAGDQGYRDGIADGGVIPGWGGASNWPLFIGARNAGGVAISFWAGDCYAIGIKKGPALTGPQVAAAAAAMAAL